MTTIRMTNEDNTLQSGFLNTLSGGSTLAFYIELPSQKASISYDKKIFSTRIGEEKGSKWEDGPNAIHIDFLDVTKKIIIQGRIDRHANKTAAWAVNPLADAALVRDRILWMVDHGETVKLTVGTAGDGYGTDAVLGTGGTRTYEGQIIRAKFEEIAADETVATQYQMDLDFEVTVHY